MKFSIGSDPSHEVEILPGTWVTVMAWMVLNFTMGFVGVQWPNIWFRVSALCVIYLIILYNITIDNRCLVDIYIKGESHA